MTAPSGLPPGRVVLASKGIEAVLKRPAVAAMVTDMAERVAAATGLGDGEVFVDGYATDRQSAAVVVPAHRQAVDGALTRAAASVGLIVRQ